MLYVNVNEVPTINKLRAVHDPPAGVSQTPAQFGRQIYDRTCAACHGAELQCIPPQTPALLDLKRPAQEMEAVIVQGRNSIPAFRHIRPRELRALLLALMAVRGAIAGSSAV